MSDPGNYRTKDELEEFRSTDPIERLKSYILDKKLAKQADIDSLVDEVEKEVLEAVDFANESAFPDPSELYEHIFSGDELVIHDHK